MVEQLLADLEALRTGDLSPESFRLRHPIRDVSGYLEAILGNLEHYLADRDIRESDPDYKSLQDAQLAKLMDHLCSGRFEQAARIDFLSVSHA